MHTAIINNMVNVNTYTFIIPVQCTKDYAMLTGTIQIDAIDYLEGACDASQYYGIYIKEAFRFRDISKGNEAYLPSFQSFKQMIENQAEMIDRMEKGG